MIFKTILKLYHFAKMIECRRLTEKELNRLINEAPDSETRNLIRVLCDEDISAYNFFDSLAVENTGLIADGRPIYFAAITQTKNGTFEIWTIVNRDVKAQFSLFKHSKRQMQQFAKKYKKIYATMEKVCDVNMCWTERLGFKKTQEDKNTITYCFQG